MSETLAETSARNLFDGVDQAAVWNVYEAVAKYITEPFGPATDEAAQLSAFEDYQPSDEMPMRVTFRKTTINSNNIYFKD